MTPRARSLHNLPGTCASCGHTISCQLPPRYPHTLHWADCPRHTYVTIVTWEDTELPEEDPDGYHVGSE